LILLSFPTDPGLDPGEERESIFNKTFSMTVFCLVSGFPLALCSASGMTA